MQSARVPCSHRWCPRVPLEPDLPWLGVKGSACPSGDKGSIPGWGRFPGGGNGSPLQYSCLGIPMDKGAWRATVPGIAKESDTT